MHITASIGMDGKIALKGNSFKMTKDKNAALAPFGKYLHCYGLKSIRFAAKPLFMLRNESRCCIIRP